MHALHYIIYIYEIYVYIYIFIFTYTDICMYFYYCIYRYLYIERNILYIYFYLSISIYLIYFYLSKGVILLKQSRVEIYTSFFFGWDFRHIQAFTPQWTSPVFIQLLSWICLLFSPLCPITGISVRCLPQHWSLGNTDCFFPVTPGPGRDNPSSWNSPQREKKTLYVVISSYIYTVIKNKKKEKSPSQWTGIILGGCGR